MEDAVAVAVAFVKLFILCPWVENLSNLSRWLFVLFDKNIFEETPAFENEFEVFKVFM
jgi:hypothetical protein